MDTPYPRSLIFINRTVMTERSLLSGVQGMRVDVVNKVYRGEAIQKVITRIRSRESVRIHE
jgi:hypothetical protein